MAESDIQFAGFAGSFSAEKKSKEKCQDHIYSYMECIPFISQQQALKSQQGKQKSSCQPWKEFDMQCIVLWNVLAHMEPVIKPNQQEYTSKTCCIDKIFKNV